MLRGVAAVCPFGRVGEDTEHLLTAVQNAEALIEIEGRELNCDKR